MSKLRSVLRPAVLAPLSLLLVALLAAAPLWGPGMVNTRGGGDSPFLLLRTQQMRVNLQAGVFPVRWMPDAAYGLGYPFFSYYSALPYYLAGLLALVGVDILTALKLVQTVGFAAAGLAMYGWMGRMTRSRWAAWLAGVAYIVAPFHLVNVYVRGDSLSEFYAFVFYPLILWGMAQIADCRLQGRAMVRPARIVFPALAYAGLILSHNLSAAIFSPFALLYLGVLSLRGWRVDGRVLGRGLLALALGFLLSAWCAVPALAEVGQAQLGPSTQGYFHYSNHFRSANLVQGSLLFDYSVAAELGDRSPFAMGLAQATFAALGILALVVRWLRRRGPTGAAALRWGFVLFGLLLSTTMITPLSRPLWDHLPLLPTVQFPWRFLSVQALFAAAVTAALVPGAFSASPRPLVSLSPCLLVFTAVLLAASTLLSLHPDRLPITAADVTTERLQLYELFTGNIGTTIRSEWLYRAVVPRPYTADALIEPGAPGRAIPLDGAAVQAAQTGRRPTEQTWRVWGDGGSIAFPLLYWPGWSARVDGEPTAVWPVEGSGYLALTVPPGEHTVRLALGRTPVRAAAELVSLLTLVWLTAVGGWGMVTRRHGDTETRRHGDTETRRQGDGETRRGADGQTRLLAYLSTCLLAYLPTCLLATYLLAHLHTCTLAFFPSPLSDLTMDFDQMPYLHHNPGGVDFGAARLDGYTLSADELAPGDTLTVALDWADGSTDPLTVTLGLFSPAVTRYEVAPLAAASCNRQSAICNSLPLVLPPDTPRGLYLLQLRLFGPDGELHARSREGTAQGTLYLQPVRVPRGPALPADASVLAPIGPDIRLHAVAVEQPAADRLAVRLAWSAARPLAANYGISLRLLNADGQAAVTLDTQPGYGFLPTSLWRPDELTTDRYRLALPPDLPPGDYRLQVILYQVSTLAAVGQAVTDGFTLPLAAPFEAQRPPRLFTLPPLEHPLDVAFGGQVRLAGYDLAQDAEALRLTLWWQALQAPSADYTVFVHLFGPESPAPLVQRDAMPRDGAYPTSWWAAGEVVSETVALRLAELPPGTYRLAVGLYDQTVTRLAAVGPDGQPVPDDRFVLPVEVNVRP